MKVACEARRIDPMHAVSTQAYYTSLLEFRDYFETGVPVLMYHKIGPRPKGTMMKALYCSKELFNRQMKELHDSGFTSTHLEEVCATPDNRARRFAITFDDGFKNVMCNAAATLAEHKFHAIQFIVAGLIGCRNEWDLQAGEAPEALMDAPQIRDWLAAGHQIGAHSITHPHLLTLPDQKAREEISGSRKRLEDIFGVPITHFCYPYGEWDEKIRCMTEEAGYLTACTTGTGVNTLATSRFEVKRWLVRYPDARPKELLRRLRDRIFN